MESRVFNVLLVFVLLLITDPILISFLLNARCRKVHGAISASSSSSESSLGRALRMDNLENAPIVSLYNDLRPLVAFDGKLEVGGSWQNLTLLFRRGGACSIVFFKAEMRGEKVELRLFSFSFVVVLCCFEGFWI